MDSNYQWRKGLVNLVDDLTTVGTNSSTLTINPTSNLNAANDYNVVVSGDCLPDAISIDVSLTVNSLPVITTQPINEIVCSGESASFEVVSTNAVNYQWRKGIVNIIDDLHITGSNTSILTINPASALDAGLDYNVVVSGVCLPDVISQNVSLQVDEAPVIITQPISQIICDGNTANFSVVASNAVSYQWRIGNVDLINGANTSGANTATLTINPVSILDAATDYNVVVTGNCLPDVTSIDVALEVSSLPVIVTEPTDLIVCEGNSATFSVTASGTNLSYQWRIGTTFLTDGGNISGSNSSTLTINPVTINDIATNYNVVVTGSCSPIINSTDVSLSVNTIPIITSLSSDQTICSGNSTTLSVIALGRGLTYQWRIGTTNLTDGGNISGSNTNILSINPISVADNALDYNVVVTGTCTPELISENISVVAILIPVAVASNNSPVCVGNTINFTAQTVANATYEWTNSNGYLSTNQNPEILDASTLDAGVYTLVVSINDCVSEPTTTMLDVNICVDTDFKIPEGFSPNGDGINDFFVIRGIFNFPDNTFVIFNRWGDKVYEASPYTNKWEGKAIFGVQVGGDDLPSGTYFYVLDLGDGSDIYKGTIYLNR